MHTNRLQRILPLSGVLFTLIMVTALVLTRGEADSGASSEKIFAYWHGHYGALYVYVGQCRGGELHAHGAGSRQSRRGNVVLTGWWL